MTVKEELELLAKDCEGAALEAGSEAERRMCMSIAYCIRHAAKRLMVEHAR